MKFELKYSYSTDGEPEPEPDPYTVMDGKWGGMGPQTWFRGRDIGLPEPFWGNVYEIKTKLITTDINGRYYLNYWYQYWDVSKEEWIPVSQSIKDKLPTFNVYYNKTKIPSKIFLPIINRVFPELDMREILKAQPMTDYGEEKNN